ncbi:MAG: class I SAM-dependent methyltransferase [Anaerolineales bacterium]
MEDTKQRVREFYDEIGWRQGGEGLYQNARFEDMRPISREYIHNCHLRVNRHISRRGQYLLDAGSGPLQWTEYLTYSEGYRFRVCADISITALKAARSVLGGRGLYVVADIANLPFRSDAMGGLVSIHAVHHLPLAEHRKAYLEFQRVLRPGASAAVVNGWYRPPLMRLGDLLIQLGRIFSGRALKRKRDWKATEDQQGTFVEKMTPAWLRKELAGTIEYETYAWRSLSPRFMQWFIRPQTGGATLLRLVFWLEDRFPQFFGRYWQYPLIVIHKRRDGRQNPAGA